MPNKHRRGGVKQQHSIIPGIRKDCRRSRPAPMCRRLPPATSHPPPEFGAGGSLPVFPSNRHETHRQSPWSSSGNFCCQLPAGCTQLVDSIQSSSPGREPSRKALQPETQRQNNGCRRYRRANRRSLPDTLRRYMQLSNGGDSPLMVAVGDRLNGKMDDFRNKLLHEAETKKKQKGKRSSKAVYPKFRSAPFRPAPVTLPPLHHGAVAEDCRQTGT